MGLSTIVKCLHQGEKTIFIPQGWGDCSTCIYDENNKWCKGYVQVISYVFYVYSREEIKTLETTKKEKEKILP